MSNDKVDKLTLGNNEDDEKKVLEEKEKNKYSGEEVARYTICKINLIRKYIHFDIVLSVIKYHHRLLKLLNKLKLFKE